MVLYLTDVDRSLEVNEGDLEDIKSVGVCRRVSCCCNRLSDGLGLLRYLPAGSLQPALTGSGVVATAGIDAGGGALDRAGVSSSAAVRR